MAEVKNRIQYIDVVKGMGICLVVLCHAKFPINHFFTMFYLPMFFLASGYFYSSKQPFSAFFWKKTKGLYLKFIVFGLILLCLRPIFIKMQWYSYNPIAINNYVQTAEDYSIADYLMSASRILTLNVPEQLMRPMWFVGVLFISLILMKTLDCLLWAKTKNKIVELASVVILFFIGFYFKLPGFLSNSLVAMLFCWSGWKVRKLELDRKLFKLKPSIKIILFLGCIGICILASWKTDLIMMTNTYTTWWTMLISSFAGITFMFLLAESVSKSMIGKAFVYIGQNSFVILMLHVITFKAVTWVYIILNDIDNSCLCAYPIITNDMPWWLVYSAVGIVLPLTLKWIYLRIRNYMQGGNRQ